MWRHLGGICGALALVLSGCASSNNNNGVSVRASNSEALSFQGREVGAIDLIGLIDPENRRQLLPGRDCAYSGNGVRREQARRQAYANEFACALEAFNTYYMTYAEYEAFIRNSASNAGNGNDQHYEASVSSLALAVKRNQIQDTIMIRSDTLCSDFQRRLGLDLRVGNEATGFRNWFANYSSLVVSGIGSLFLNGDAIFVITNAARYGTPGYVNDEDKLEATVIRIAIDGIGIARDELLEEINARRYFIKGEGDPLTGPEIETVEFAPLLQSVTMEISNGTPPGTTDTYKDIQKTVGVVNVGTYPLEQGLADVIEYHGACSIASGLTKAADALEYKQHSQ